jgi:hypothetical protein
MYNTIQRFECFLGRKTNWISILVNKEKEIENFKMLNFTGNKT